MRTLIEVQLAKDPPNCAEAEKLLREALLDARNIDPLERAWAFIADSIAHRLPEGAPQAEFWQRMESLFARDLPGAHPGVRFPLGHQLYRRALVSLRTSGEVALGRQLLEQSFEQDKLFGVPDGSSAAVWTLLLETMREEELDALGEAQQATLVDALTKACEDRGRPLDSSTPARIEAIAQRTGASPERQAQYAELARARYDELSHSALAGFVIPTLACSAYLAEWCAVLFLRHEGLETVETRGGPRALEHAYLPELVAAVTAKQRAGGDDEALGLLLAVVQSLRNRIHVGNDLRRKVPLSAPTAMVIAHLTDRVLLEAARAFGTSPVGAPT